MKTSPPLPCRLAQLYDSVVVSLRGMDEEHRRSVFRARWRARRPGRCWSPLQREGEDRVRIFGTENEDRLLHVYRPRRSCVSGWRACAPSPMARGLCIAIGAEV